MFESVHAQSVEWAGEDTNGGTYNYTDISTTGVSSIGNYCSHWNRLKGYVPKLVPAEMKIYRNIGVWRYQRDVRLSVHAQSDMNRNIGVRSSWDASEWRYKQSDRWGRFKLRNPPNDTLSPDMTVEDLGHHDQGGVVDWWPRVQSPRPRSSAVALMIRVRMNRFARFQCHAIRRVFLVVIDQ